MEDSINRGLRARRGWGCSETAAPNPLLLPKTRHPRRKIGNPPPRLNHHRPKTRHPPTENSAPARRRPSARRPRLNSATPDGGPVAHSPSRRSENRCKYPRTHASRRPGVAARTRRNSSENSPLPKPHQQRKPVARPARENEGTSCTVCVWELTQRKGLSVNTGYHRTEVLIRMEFAVNPTRAVRRGGVRA